MVRRFYINFHRVFGYWPGISTRGEYPVVSPPSADKRYSGVWIPVRVPVTKDQQLSNAEFWLVRARMHGFLHHVDPEEFILFWMTTGINAPGRHAASYYRWEEFLDKHEAKLTAVNK